MTDTKRTNVWRPGRSQPSKQHLNGANLRRPENRSTGGRTNAHQNTNALQNKGKSEKGTVGEALSELFRRVNKRVGQELNADALLGHTVTGFIEMARARYALDPGATWQPGHPLKLLLAGYSGTRNTGADARVEEMIRQFRHLFGDDNLELSIFTIEPKLTKGYFRTVRQLHLPKVFPKFLFDSVHAHHGVITCEGSMFKSKFANALSTMMVGALGLALAEEKIAVGYGGEAGAMDPELEDLVRRHCKGALVIARNHESKGVLARLGVEATAGTDTAWTFEPAPPSVGRSILMERGWDGKTPVLALCPINPFWWPVTAKPARALLNHLGNIQTEEHFGSMYFHKGGKEVADKQDAYLSAIAEGVLKLQAETDVFPVLFGSEQLDRLACEGLAEKLEAATGKETPVIVSDEFNMYEMVSAMRQATYMVSSRYHAIVTTMAGDVASAGITMDERIRNLMKDRGTPALALEVDDANLADEVYHVLKRLISDRAEIMTGIERCLVTNLERMGQMGMLLVEHVRKKHAAFPFRPELGAHGDPWQHLPEMSPALNEIVARVKKSGQANLQTPNANAV